MVKFAPSLILLVIVVLHQVCAASPITTRDDENDVMKLFSPAELQRATNEGITDQQLIDGRSFGLTLDEMIKLHPLRKAQNVQNNDVTFEFMDNVCKSLLPAYKTATSHTRTHQIHLNELINEVLKRLPKADHAPFIRTTLCDYISDPSSYESRAGLQVVRYTRIHFLKVKAQNASAADRVKVFKEICCAHEGRDGTEPGVVRDPLNFGGLPDGELNEFSKHANEFMETNSLDSLENICNFLHAKNPHDECKGAEVGFFP